MSSLEPSSDQVFVFKASEAQRSLWFLEQLAPGRSLYNLHIGKRITSGVDVSALESSVNEVVRRHEALRTAFRDVNNETMQVIASKLHIPLRFTDLRHLPEDEREEWALTIADDEASRPFDQTMWPLLHTRLVQVDDEDYIFFLTIHHILCDYWSLQILQDELSSVYTAISSHQPSPLDDVPLQYADFSEWERAWIDSPAGRAQLEYWRKQLADLPVVELSSDHPRPRLPTFAGAGIDFEVRHETYDALKRIGREESATLFMVTLAAMQTVLQRHTGLDDIVVGTSVANRAHPDVEALVGYLVNTLVLRTDLSGDPTFRELVARVRSVAMDAYSHQQLPFNMLVSALRPERIAGDNPLFHVHFQLFSDGTPSSDAGLMAEEAFYSEPTTTQFDLGLDLWEYDGLVGHIEYSTELFAHETVERFAEHFVKVLDAVAVNADYRISEISLLDHQDIRRLTVEWNDTAVEPTTTEFLHRAFELEVERHPGTMAVICGPDRLTYAELDERATRLARHLRSLGVGREDIVATSAERSSAYVIATLAALKAGAAFLPVNLLDPAPRVSRVLNLAHPKVLISRTGSVDHLGDRIPTVDPEAVWRMPSDSTEAGDIACADGSPDTLAYVIYTSGSTGEPRGVQISHRAVTNHLRWMLEAVPLTAQDRTLLKYPLTFDAAVCEVFYPLLAGACLVVAPPAEHWNVSEFVHLCHDVEVTVLDVVPSMLDTLLGEPEFAHCQSIRRVICGGEELRRDLCERFFSQTDAELYNVYGPTEATIGTTGWDCRHDRASSDVPIGRPVSNSRIYVFDRALHPVPTGVRGELYVAGIGLARGYLEDPATTAEKFLPDPYSVQPGARMYRTGDRAWYSPDGVLHYAGRIDNQVKIRGFRVESGDIEAELSHHQMVRRCSVVPVEDDRHRTRLVAYILPTPPPPELWPSVGDYGVYDELLYYALTHDERRNEAYRTAIASAVSDKVVVDLGTGADAILARFCVDAGARHVYAVEVSEQAFDSAKTTVSDLGLTERITVLHGDSTQVALPEPADVCVSELIGMIGSSEGAVPILNDAWRLLKMDATMIPHRCVTKFAPFMLPENLASSPRFTGLPRLYTKKVFSKVGHPFDLRVCIKNCPPENLLAEPMVFEDLDFRRPSDPNTTSESTFTVSADARLDGFLFWLNLYPDESDMVDSLVDRLSWLPVFMPAFEPGVRVGRGDVLRVRCVTTIPDGERLPDYQLAGVVERLDGDQLSFSVSSLNQTQASRATPFYDALLSDLGVHDRSISAVSKSESTADGTARGAADESPILDLGPRLRQFLQQRLPDYMVPSTFVILDADTSVTTGKLDLPKLANQRGLHGLDRHSSGWHAPAAGAEEIIAGVWCDVLNLSHVDRRDNFFDLGGDSLLITQVRAQLERLFRRQISIIDLFRYPTVTSLGAFLNNGDAAASPRPSTPPLRRNAEPQLEIHSGSVGS
jgi:amino acid adenylation domain-containing protein